MHKGKRAGLEFEKKVIDPVTAMETAVKYGVRHAEKIRSSRLGYKVGQLRRALNDSDSSDNSDVKEAADKALYRKSGSLNALRSNIRFRHM